MRETSASHVARPRSQRGGPAPSARSLAEPRSGLPERLRAGRVVIEAVSPEIDGGLHPIKRIVGEEVEVCADVFAEGHDVVACALLHRFAGEAEWDEVPMRPLGNDRWSASFTVPRLGRHVYTIVGWVDHFATWRRDLQKKVEAQQDVAVDLQIGANLIRETIAQAKQPRRYATQAQRAEEIASDGIPIESRLRIALDEELAKSMSVCGRWSGASCPTRYERELEVIVDPALAGFSAWYEVFPRSCAAERGRHGTFRDLEQRLPYIADMGFDVLYLPPIHPIGRTFRKGANNSVRCEPGDVGSPWAIGAEEGGHKSIHPDLGTLEDFRRLVKKAKERGLHIALDIAFQCSPDHPYVKEHPEWFRARPDGTIQYAENPPKKYQDIYPFDFETEAWESLWRELLSVFLYWIEQGVTIFRVDNPHTKPFPFWEWAIGEMKRDHPEVILLSEAFTRPKVMLKLAKLGFTQSYTYFAWRKSRFELAGYCEELTRTDAVEYFRPNFWPNTPDILTEQLQQGGRPMFIARMVLAATLSSNWGIYGPAFELCEHMPREPGSEEYLNSEKYELRHWEWERPDSLAPLIARVNAIRREHRALQDNRSLRFLRCENEALVCSARRSPDGEDRILTVVNIDPYHMQIGWVEVPLAEFGIGDDEPFEVHDLLTGSTYIWRGSWNYIELNPHALPAHIFEVRKG